MALTPQMMIGNWLTEGTQDGWSYPTSGKWKGKLSVKPGGSTFMVFTDGNVAPKRDGNWSLNGTRFSIVDDEGTTWTANVSTDGQRMNGRYDSGPAGAADGGWGARKL